MWNSVKDKLPRPGTGKVLVIFLSPFFGVLTSELGTGQYDHPDDYEDGIGKGWLDWDTDREILVTHWQELPDIIETEIEGIKQKDFIDKYGYRPNLGSIII